MNLRKEKLLQEMESIKKNQYEHLVKQQEKILINQIESFFQRSEIPPTSDNFKIVADWLYQSLLDGENIDELLEKEVEKAKKFKHNLKFNNQLKKIIEE